VIISCPNCGARYRLAVTTVAENTRMRCAKCDHRWLIEPDDELPSLTPEPPPAPPPPAPTAVANASQPVSDRADPELPPDDAADTPPRSTLLRNLAAIAIGGALAIAAGTLWVARIDPAQLPVLGDQIAALAPSAPPLKLAFAARTTPLP
jgi:predicted Zn finger-like uncharacterized protein